MREGGRERESEGEMAVDADLYSVLGVDRGARDVEVRAAARGGTARRRVADGARI